jgi:hypothetical protein
MMNIRKPSKWTYRPSAGISSTADWLHGFPAVVRTKQRRLKKKQPAREGPFAPGILYVGRQPLLRSGAFWSVLFVTALLPVLAKGDNVEIGFLRVDRSCEPAPRAPAHGIVCSGTVAVFNETSTAVMLDLGFNVGAETFSSVPAQIIEPLEGEEVEFQGNTDRYVFIPRATELSVQGELNLVFKDTFTTAAGTFDLGSFVTDWESPQFDADFQGELRIFVSATPVTTGGTTTPEPGTGGLMAIVILIAFVFVMRWRHGKSSGGSPGAAHREARAHALGQFRGPRGRCQSRVGRSRKQGSLIADLLRSSGQRVRRLPLHSHAPSAC